MANLLHFLSSEGENHQPQANGILSIKILIIMSHILYVMFIDCQGLAFDTDSDGFVPGCGDYWCGCGNMGTV